MSSDSYVVIGANRGLGLGIVQTLAAQHPGSKVVATARNVGTANELYALSKRNEGVHILQCDFTSEDSLKTAADAVRKLVRDDGVKTVIINAGQYGSKALPSELNPQDLVSLLDVNVAGPLKATQAFLPLLRASKHSQERPAKIIYLGSDAGSIQRRLDQGGNAGSTAYGVSKTALNMLAASFKTELRPENIAVLSLHPGWVKTDMGGPNAEIEVEESMAGVTKVIEGLQMDSPLFLNYTGRQVPF